MPLVEHWNGSAWSTTPPVLLSQQSMSFTAVDALASNDVWVVGSSQNGTNPSSTLVEHFDGATWTIITSPNVSSVDNHLVAVTALSDTDIWAVGNTTNPSTSVDQTLTMHWNGSAWTIISSPNIGTSSNDLHAVAALSSTDVWAVGQDGNAPSHPLALHWNGASWTATTTPTTSNLVEVLNGVSAFASNDVWTVGYTTPGLYTAKTLALHWDGTSWTAIATPNPQLNSRLTALTAVPGSHQLWAVGLQSSGDPQHPGAYTVLTEHWTGYEWAVVPGADTPITTNTYDALQAVTAVNTNNVWATGYTVANPPLNDTLIEQYVGSRISLNCPSSTPTPTPMPTPTP